MRGYLLKLDKQFKSYEHLKIEKIKIRTSYMGALLQKQRNLWQKYCKSGGNVKIYLKNHNFETACNLNTKFWLRVVNKKS